MMTTTIQHLAAQAEAYTRSIDSYGLSADHIFKILDTHGSVNANEHLANPLNHPSQGPIHDRAVPLTGAELVHGDFLVLNYCGHSPFLRLSTYTSLQHLEAAILDLDGITNQFTTYLLAFRGGKLAPYDVYYDSPSGERVRLVKTETEADAAPINRNPEVRWR